MAINLLVYVKLSEITAFILFYFLNQCKPFLHIPDTYHGKTQLQNGPQYKSLCYSNALYHHESFYNRNILIKIHAILLFHSSFFPIPWPCFQA
jgi:hypothetical protein